MGSMYYVAYVDEEDGRRPVVAWNAEQEEPDISGWDMMKDDFSQVFGKPVTIEGVSQDKYLDAAKEIAQRKSKVSV